MEEEFIACFSEIVKEKEFPSVVCNNKLKTKEEAEKWFIKECKKCKFSDQLNDIDNMFKKDVKYLYKPSRFMRAFLSRDTIKERTIIGDEFDKYFDQSVSFSQGISYGYPFVRYFYELYMS